MKGTTIRSRLNPKLEVSVIAGHFATRHSHNNHYIDITRMKHEHTMAREAAMTLAQRYAYEKGVDTIVCLDGSEVLGAFLARHLAKNTLFAVNSDKNINVITPEYDSNGQLLFRDNLVPMVTDRNVLILISTVNSGKSIRRVVECAQYYGGKVQGIAAVFSTLEEMEGVPHHMLDVVEPNQPYSVAEFQAGAYAAIDGILSRGNTPFLVGGTGLYVRAVTEGFTFTDARPDPALRAKLEGKTTAELYALLREKTGVTLTDGEEFNRQRLMRSVEKALSGQWESPPPRPRYDCLLLGVRSGQPCGEQRHGRPAHASGYPDHPGQPHSFGGGGADDSFLEGLGLEYRYILWYLTGKIPTLDALKDELGRAIKRFAKRQMVWFQKDRDVLWLDMEGDFLTQAVQAVEDFLA